MIRHIEESPIVTLVGERGVGKSSVAERVVELLSVAGWRTSMVDLASSAEGLTDDSPSDALDSSATGVGLVWIDNALAANPFALELIARLRKVPGRRLLVTSRCMMRVADERVVLVGPITDPGAAARLFVHAATAAGSRVRFDATHTGQIHAICGLLDGWPLAIEMAARRTVVQSPAELLAALRTHTLSSILDGEHADGCTLTIAGVVAATIATLNDEPREAAERLATLTDWWTIEEVTELLPDSRPRCRVGAGRPSRDRGRRPRHDNGVQGPSALPRAARRRGRRSVASRFAGTLRHCAVEGLLDGSTRGGGRPRTGTWRSNVAGPICRRLPRQPVDRDPPAAAVIALALSMHAAERGNLAVDGGLLDRVLVAIDRGGPVTPSLAVMLARLPAPPTDGGGRSDDRHRTAGGRARRGGGGGDRPRRSAV